MKKKQINCPLPIFDSLEYLSIANYEHLNKQYDLQDINMAHRFIHSYKGSIGTFNSYRREIERLLHWCYLIVGKKLKELKRDDIENYISFCQKPPRNWIGLTKPPRFIVKDSIRIPNASWRPFVVTISKASYRMGKMPNLNEFILSQSALKELFAILSSFFNYLLQEEYLFTNPVALIRQKSKYIRKTQGHIKIRRLSELQWQTVIKLAEELAEKNPELHERTLFIMSLLYSLYLRISELTANERFTPTMNHFSRDADGNWWFTTVGKGNKERTIAVSDAMLNALKRFRKFLQLSSLPSPADTSFLLPKTHGAGPITSTNHIRQIVQYCFDQAIEKLKADGLAEEAETLNEATVHWLRHTGISDDVKIRPLEHVRDDAGHSSIATTDKYINVEMRARHSTAKKKVIVEKD